MQNINFLKKKSAWLRKEIFELCYKAKQGHPGSVLSEIDILISLFYGGLIKYEKNNPFSEIRDRIIISKGHATMGLYPIFADIGYFSKNELESYGENKGLLRIFGNISIPGVDATSGSLGHGLGIGSGFALADKMDKNKRRTYVIISEGEMYEGSIWESALFANHYDLDNLFVFLDRNKKIILGDTEDLVKLEPIVEKWETFGFKSVMVNGHSHADIIDAHNKLLNEKGPKLIVADTIKGKGISFMEGKPNWHYWNQISDQELSIARDELIKEINIYE